MNRPKHIALSKSNASLLAKDDQISPHELTAEIPFGPLLLSLEDMAPHSVLVGATGAGKTIIQKSIMQAVLPAPAHHGGLRYRATVYDPKRELYPFLVAAGIPHDQIIVTHPFDDRSAAWDLAVDFQEPAQIEELAKLIVPEQKQGLGENEFFHTAARIIVQEVIEGLRAVLRNEWTLRDITEACSSVELIRSVMRQTRSGKESAEIYFGDGETGRMSESVYATLHNYVRPFHTLAALWHRAAYKFSLHDWHLNSGILLLGADPRRARTVQRINQLMVQRICQLVLGRQEERPIDCTWFFFDEIREAGKLKGLRQLMTEGRSKGARVVIGFQDVDGMKALYGEHQTQEMIGLCANRIVLHLDNPQTTKWASEVFGEAEVVQVDESSSRSESSSYGHKTVTNQAGNTQRIAMRVNALPIEFQDLPLASLETGVQGWFAVPGRRNRFHILPDDVRSYLKLGASALDPNQGEPAFVERPVEHQERILWSDEETSTLQAERLQPGSLDLGDILEQTQ